MEGGDEGFWVDLELAEGQELASGGCFRWDGVIRRFPPNLRALDALVALLQYRVALRHLAHEGVNLLLEDVKHVPIFRGGEWESLGWGGGGMAPSYPAACGRQPLPRHVDARSHTPRHATHASRGFSLTTDPCPCSCRFSLCQRTNPPNGKGFV